MIGEVSESIPKKSTYLCDITGIGFELKMRANQALWESLTWDEQWEIRDYYNNLAKRMQHLMRDAEQALEVKYAELAEKEHDGVSEKGVAEGKGAKRPKEKDAQSDE